MHNNNNSSRLCLQTRICWCQCVLYAAAACCRLLLPVARYVAHTPCPTYSCSGHLLDVVVISSMLCCSVRFIQEQAGSIRHGNSRHGCLRCLHRRVRRGVRPAYAPRKRDLPLPQQHEGEGDPGCSRGWSLQQVMKAKTNNTYMSDT